MSCYVVRSWALLERKQPTRIVFPSHRNYIFYQYDEVYGHKITRPLNSDLFIESAHDFQIAFERFAGFLDHLKQQHQIVAEGQGGRQYIDSREINKVVYTIQQAIGSIGDSFDNANQTRKRNSQL